MAQQAFYIDMPAVGVFFIGLKLLDLAIPRKSADQKALPENSRSAFRATLLLKWIGIIPYGQAPESVRLYGPAEFGSTDHR
jgi:hypothetical protein